MNSATNNLPSLPAAAILTVTDEQLLELGFLANLKGDVVLANICSRGVHDYSAREAAAVEYERYGEEGLLD